MALEGSSHARRACQEAQRATWSFCASVRPKSSEPCSESGPEPRHALERQAPLAAPPAAASLLRLRAVLEGFCLAHRGAEAAAWLIEELRPRLQGRLVSMWQPWDRSSCLGFLRHQSLGTMGQQKLSKGLHSSPQHRTRKSYRKLSSSDFLLPLGQSLFLCAQIS